MRKKLLTVGVLTALLLLPALARADSFIYTTTAADSGPGAGITYSLTATLLSGQTYSATFTVTSTLSAGASPWYAGWFNIKFDGASKSTLSGLTGPAGTGPWSMADSTQNSTVKVLAGGGNYSQLLSDGFSGIYVTSLAQGLPTDDITQGLKLNQLGGSAPKSYTFTFNFTLPTGGTLASSTCSGVKCIPFQVGYYDGLTGAGAVQTNQLSKDLTKVPEPASMALLGTGLIGLAGIVRRRLRR